MAKQKLAKTFRLEGVTYYQQMRSCGNKRCKKCPNGHGPYWLSRDNETGKRKHLGRELPQEVQRALEGFSLNAQGLETDIRNIQAQLARLLKLKDRESLSEVDKIILRGMGYGLNLLPDESESEPSAPLTESERKKRRQVDKVVEQNKRDKLLGRKPQQKELL